MTKDEQYRQALLAVRSLVEDESDEIAVMASVVCELHHRFERFHWTGFYRVTSPGVLTVGPYQGGHGCARIPFDRGVCGRAAREEATQVVADVRDLPYHIACSSTTRSEIVVPVHDRAGRLIAVLDVDSDEPAAFDGTDRRGLEEICRLVGSRLG